MALTSEIFDIIVKNSGDKFQDKMHSVSVKLVLKDGAVVIHEQSFVEKHKDIYNIADTMEKIRINMSATKKRIESELALKTVAEAEVPGMLTKIKAEAK